MMATAAAIQDEEKFDNDPEIVDLDWPSPTKGNKSDETEILEPNKTELTFEEMQANLDEFVEAEEQKNKPKRKTVAELLKSLPGYGNILDKKPIIRPSVNLEIDFSDCKSFHNDDPKQKGIQNLIKRFQVHTAAGKIEKEQHFKIHIAKKEEDSQGINQIKVDEVDYVKVISTEEQEQQDSTSPCAPAPGVKMSLMKSKLLAEIRIKRAKQYEEKMKAHAMYSEEKDLDDKQEEEEEEEEEILEDEISDESEIEESDVEIDEDKEEDVDEDKEEDIETLLDANPETEKKVRKRIAYFEDEADESNEGNKSADEDEDKLDRPQKEDISFIDDRPISDDDDDDDDNTGEDPEKEKQNSENFDSEYNVYSSQDLFSEFANDVESQKTQGTQGSTSSPCPSFLDPNRTPVVSASILTRRPSPIGPWTSIFRHPTSSGDNMLPFIPRMNSDSALDAFCEDMSKTPVNNKTPTISVEVSKLVGTQEPTGSDIDDELEEICSVRFPSQQPATPLESQESECFGFGSEEDLVTSKEMATPNVDGDKSTIETPKIVERNRIGSKRLNFQNVVDTEQVKSGLITADPGDDDDDEDHIIGVKVQRKRKRALMFSDDEDSADDEEEKEDDNVDDDRDSEEEEMHQSEMDEESMQDVMDQSDAESVKEYDENEEEIPKFKGLMSKKTGMLRKEFVDAEAELSGDDVDSADEDERGLDELEQEAGDDDEIDEESLRNQVGKTHLKMLLDEDQREIRYLKDVYLEQGDLYTDGKERERQFKWKNIDKYDDDQPSGVNGEGVEIAEDESEARRQKERLEKIKWMKAHSQTEDILVDADPDESSQMFLKDSQYLKLTNTTMRKIQSVNSVTTSLESVVKTKAATALAKKGSFLQREISSISRLAEMSKINDSVKVTNKLVFSVITPPSMNGDDSTNSNRKQYRKQPKKIAKVEPSEEKLDRSKSQLFQWI